MKTRRSAANLQLEEIDKLRTALRKAEAEVQRLLDEAAARGALVDILHDVMGSLSMGELFHMLGDYYPLRLATPRPTSYSRNPIGSCIS